MKETAQMMGIPYSFGTDYSLFEEWTVLPRLTLSYGCMNNCKFCIVPHEMSTVPKNVIEQQVDSFQDLYFRLIYIDDKTFGQAENYRIIGELGERIRRYNPQFNGFVIQTTTGLLSKRAIEFRNLGVVVAEVGAETFNDRILRAYRKPSSEKMILKSIEAAKKAEIMIIPNLIVGFPEETESSYRRTYGFLEDYAPKLFGINFAMYTDYSSQECIGEVDFAPSAKINLHRKYWKILNDLATCKVIDQRKAPIRSCNSERFLISYRTERQISA